MDTTTRPWDRSRALRERVYRHTLTEWLRYAVMLDTASDDEVEQLAGRVRQQVAEIEPAWRTDRSLEHGGARRAALRTALPMLHRFASTLAGTVRGVAECHLNGVVLRMAMAGDRAQRTLHGPLDAAILWVGTHLLAEIDRNLIRACAFTGCRHVFVGVKAQQFCSQHQAEVRRQTQQRALRAFRQRQRATKKGRKRG